MHRPFERLFDYRRKLPEASCVAAPHAVYVAANGGQSPASVYISRSILQYEPTSSSDVELLEVLGVIASYGVNEPVRVGDGPATFHLVGRSRVLHRAIVLIHLIKVSAIIFSIIIVAGTYVDSFTAWFTCSHAFR